MMETRTYYVPANRIGLYLINHMVERIGCSIGDIRKVNDTLAVSVTTVKRDISKVERILKFYDLI